MGKYTSSLFFWGLKTQDRFKDDPYTFDAFASVVLKACAQKHTTPSDIFDSLRYLFQQDANDLMDELRRSQLATSPEEPRGT